MILFPAIDLYEGKAVRLYKGDYAQMTVYSNDPMAIARDFEKQGAQAVHLVDLEGAKNGDTPNLNVVREIAGQTSLFTEIGGGIRSMETVAAYLENGVDRVILGTAAVNDEGFLKSAIAAYGKCIAVGVDVKDGFVAIKGWMEKSSYSCLDFCRKMVDLGVEYLICTDISKDGAMQGTNRELYRELSEKFPVNITASGGVSTLEDIRALQKLGLYGAIVGKAYYSGAISLADALEAAK